MVAGVQDQRRIYYAFPLLRRRRHLSCLYGAPPGRVRGRDHAWNFPLGQAIQKIAPAIAFGCTIVLKPSEEASLTTLRLGELILEAGIPDGAINIVTGYGQEAGQALVDHPKVRKIAFTGSTATGQRILQSSARQMKRVTLELGGKSPTIVLADADLDKAIPGAANAIFPNSGQVCTAGSRLFIEASIFDEVSKGLPGLPANFGWAAVSTPTRSLVPDFSPSDGTCFRACRKWRR